MSQFKTCITKSKSGHYTVNVSLKTNRKVIGHTGKLPTLESARAAAIDIIEGREPMGQILRLDRDYQAKTREERRNGN